jgi:hypothetical protein
VATEASVNLLKAKTRQGEEEKRKEGSNDHL